MYPTRPGNPGNHPQRGPGSGRLGSGVLSQPTQLPLAPPSPSHPPVSPRTPTSLPDDLNDLAPTEPQMPSLPKLPRVPTRTPEQRRILIATYFSEYMLGQDWTQDDALAAIPLARRMRLYSTLAPVYLRVLQATGRMELPGR